MASWCWNVHQYPAFFTGKLWLWKKILAELNSVLREVVDLSSCASSLCHHGPVTALSNADTGPSECQPSVQYFL